ncbi:MAG: phage head closure protein [Peptococcaceae bacterium]|nr:phage head closure protein [Peptococcaceae bacterium]
MASYNTPILIQQLDSSTERWSDYCRPRANINKTAGGEYFDAGTNISRSTYEFRLRYCLAVEKILFNTESYRIVYGGRGFDIKDADRFAESTAEIKLVGEYNGATRIDQ